jgi:uncharacterized YigZ family protein
MAQTLHEPHVHTTEVKGSTFIAHLIPYRLFGGFQAQLKRDHPKASHVVYAVRYRNDQGQVVENSSDDGEPKGAAGLPILNVLRGNEMLDAAVCVVRYFGGTKLGIGGMVRAYTLAAQEVIAHAPIEPHIVRIQYRFTTPYAAIDKTLYRLRRHDITQYQREFGTHEVHWIITASQEAIEAFLATQ